MPALPKKVKVLFPINDENISDLFNKGIYSIPVPFNFEYSEQEIIILKKLTNEN